MQTLEVLGRGESRDESGVGILLRAQSDLGVEPRLEVVLEEPLELSLVEKVRFRAEGRSREALHVHVLPLEEGRHQHDLGSIFLRAAQDAAHTAFNLACPRGEVR